MIPVKISQYAQGPNLDSASRRVELRVRRVRGAPQCEDFREQPVPEVLLGRMGANGAR